MTIEDAYRTLNLEAGASAAAVRQSYLDLVKVWHPDRFEHDDRLRQKAAAHLADINEAYAVLRGSASPDVDTRATDPTASTTDPLPMRSVRSNARHIAIAAVMAVAALVAISVILTKPGAPRSTMVNVGAAATTATAADSPVTTAADTNASARSTTREAPAADPAPEPVRPPDDRSPESGTDVRVFTGRGHAPLSLTNQTGADSLVLLSPASATAVETNRDAGARVIFIRRGEKVTLLDLVPGDYRVRLVLGAEWNGSRFARPSAHFARTMALTLADGPPTAATSLTLTRGGDFQPVAPFTID